MPLPLEAESKLTELGKVSGGFALFGIAMNPESGEICTYSSHGLTPTTVLKFLQNAITTMEEAAQRNELEYIGGDDATSLQPQGAALAPQQRTATGGKLELVH